MIGLGPNSVFIIAAYLGTALLLGGLIAYLVLDARRVRQRLLALEAQGVRRRSAEAQP